MSQQRPTGKPLRLSYERFSLSDDMVLLCIPEWFRATLLDLTHRLLWSRVWTDDAGTAVTLTEEDRRRVEYGIYKLSQEECDMEINVNTTCKCGGCATTNNELPTTIICYTQDGTPVLTPQPPVEPTEPPPPNADAWPVDPLVDPAPDGFGDWSTFDVEACAAANAVWQLAYTWVTVAEGGIDTIATILAAIAFFAANVAAEIIAIFTGPAVFKLADAIVKIILSEQASDILNEAREWLETNKQEIVCTVFQYRYDIPGMQLQLVRMFYAWIYTTLQLSDEEQRAVHELGLSIFPLNVLLAYFFEYQRYIDATSPVDCSTCGHAWQWVISNYANSTETIEYQSESEIHVSGYVGETGFNVRGGAGPEDGLQSIVRADTRAVSFYVIEISTDYAGGFGGSGNVGLDMFTRAVGESLPNRYRIQGKSMLLKLSDYAGPLNYDIVLSLSGSELYSPEQLSWDNRMFRWDTFSNPLKHYNIVFRISNLRFLDVNGNELETVTVV